MRKEDKILWCLKQKRGITLGIPNDNLCRAYFKKAKSALNMLSSAVQKDEVDWIASTAYYARYFALYALLKKCGITSEIHECTIVLLRLFVKEGIVKESFYKELQAAKQLRIDMQYYVVGELDVQKLEMDAQTAGMFVLEMERVIDGMTKQQIKQVRDKLRVL
jgi:uncharacterized protein (UPF0332 family)